MIETTILAALIASVLLAWRHGLRPARRVWVALTWWERVLLVLCLAPIPGPVDEIAGGWLILRGARRLRGVARGVVVSDDTNLPFSTDVQPTTTWEN